MRFITAWTLLKMTRIVAVRILLVKGKNFQFNKESTGERGIFSVNNGTYKGYLLFIIILPHTMNYKQNKNDNK